MCSSSSGVAPRVRRMISVTSALVNPPSALLSRVRLRRRCPGSDQIAVHAVYDFGDDEIKHGPTMERDPSGIVSVGRFDTRRIGLRVASDLLAPSPRIDRDLLPDWNGR